MSTTSKREATPVESAWRGHFRTCAWCVLFGIAGTLVGQLVTSKAWLETPASSSSSSSSSSAANPNAEILAMPPAPGAAVAILGHENFTAGIEAAWGEGRAVFVKVRLSGE